MAWGLVKFVILWFLRGCKVVVLFVRRLFGLVEIVGGIDGTFRFLLVVVEVVEGEVGCGWFWVADKRLLEAVALTWVVGLIDERVECREEEWWIRRNIWRCRPMNRVRGFFRWRGGLLRRKRIEGRWQARGYYEEGGGVGNGYTPVELRGWFFFCRSEWWRRWFGEEKFEVSWAFL